MQTSMVIFMFPLLSKFTKGKKHWYLMVVYISRALKTEIVVWDSNWHVVSPRAKEWDKASATQILLFVNQILKTQESHHTLSWEQDIRTTVNSTTKKPLSTTDSGLHVCQFAKHIIL